MKTLRHLTNTAFVVSLALLASCSSDNDIEVNNENNNNNTNVPAEKLRFSASIEPNVVSRATLKDDNTLHWDANDKIAVFSPKANKIEEFTVESQYAGQTVAYFSSDKPSTLTPPDNSGSFPYYYAFYPAEAVKGLATGSSSSAYNRAQGYIPTEQKVTEGYTYDKSAILMMARATPAEKAFSFLNANALVKVTITNNDNGKVKYIKLLSNNNSKIMTGTATFWITTSVGTSLPAGDDTKNYVQLEIPASSGSVDYYLSVHQNTFDAGFTLLLESEFDETTHSQSIYQRVKTGSTQLLKSTIYDFGDYDVSRLKYLNNVVDLGLTSGTIWTTRNVDSTPKFVENWYDYGGYYTWGAIAQQSSYGSGDYTLGNNIYATYSYKAPGDTKAKDYYLLYTQYDVASQISGGIYCMPTKTQIEELIDLDKTYYMSNNKWNGYNGIKFTGYKNRYLWLPAGGYFLNTTFQQGSQNEGSMCYYWSRNRYDDSADYAYCLDFQNNGEVYHDLGGSYSGNGRDRRYCGKNIRPIVKNVGIERAKGFPSNY